MARYSETKTARDILQRHGLQITAQRLAVFCAVDRAPHRTAADVEHDVRGQLGAVSRQAVFDALGALTAAGVFRRVRPAGSPARYETRADDDHHHLVCRTCGYLVDVDLAGGATPCLSDEVLHGFVVDETDVTFWGRCATCRQQGPDRRHTAPRVRREEASTP